jgi:hypothetical protein
MSQILYIDDLGSKILIGKEICEIDNPLSIFTASYLTTCDSTPFYLSSAS